MSNIPYGRQSISPADIQAVIDVLKSDWITQGPTIEEFERALAEYCGAKYAVAVSSATAALHISCLALGLKPGQIAWTVPNTFVASANCALYAGAKVDFVDIDSKSLNFSAAAFDQKLSRTPRDQKPSVIIPVHFSGASCNMREIQRIASAHSVRIIEDASHAIGGSYGDGKIGNCVYSDLCVFSFHPVKIITTGEGGAVTTNSSELYEMLKRLRSHGITRDAAQMQSATEGPWYYQQIELGFNYRITDIQAALGFSQLKRLDEFVKRRRELVQRYRILLADLPITLPEATQDDMSAWHLFVVRLNGASAQYRKKVFESMRSQGIGVNVHYIPVHLQPFYRAMGFKAGDFPESEKYYSETITLPLYFELSESDQDRVVSVLRSSLQ